MLKGLRQNVVACRKDCVLQESWRVMGCEKSRRAQLNLMGVPAMDSLCDEVLGFLLKKLPIRDAIRAQSVCRRWRERLDAEKGHFVHSRGFCPLVFKRTDEQHTWSGYRSATGKWESLPSLTNVPRDVHLLPIPGSGNGLLGFKISRVYSGYIVGNPCSAKWTTLPRSADSWGNAAMFMTTTTTHDGFRVVAVRDVDTHIYKSEVDEWKKVGCSSNRRQVVSCIRSKACAAVNNRLYTTDGDLLTSFDMCSEQWADNRIRIPVSKHATQLVECAETLFAVTEEDDDTGRISVWGFGVRSQQFSLTVEMPQELRDVLTPAGPRRAIKSVGHGRLLFFWRRNRLSVVSYNLFTHEWRNLPEIVQPDVFADGDGPQVLIDAGFFVPRTELGSRSTAGAESLSSNQPNARHS